MSTPRFTRIVLAGLAGSVVLDLVDTPWSVFVMVPRLEAFTQAHGLVAHELVGPFFLLAHLGFTVLTAWIYGLARTAYGSGLKSALGVTVAMLVLNRSFGFATVLMGLMPGSIFLGFSVSFVVGALLAGVAIAMVMDRGTAAPAAA